MQVNTDITLIGRCDRALKAFDECHAIVDEMAGVFPFEPEPERETSGSVEVLTERLDEIERQVHRLVDRLAKMQGLI